MPSPSSVQGSVAAHALPLAELNETTSFVDLPACTTTSGNQSLIPRSSNLSLEVHVPSPTMEPMVPSGSTIVPTLDQSLFLTQQFPGSGSDSNETANSYFAVLSASNDCTSGEECGEDDAEKRLTRNRERNREHARRTRLRKKAQMQTLQSRVKSLDEERRFLKQRIEECSVASILLGLGTKITDDNDISKDWGISAGSLIEDDKAKKVSLLTDGPNRFKRLLVDSELDRTGGISSKSLQAALNGSKSHINWKTGMYHDPSGKQKQLTEDQLETLRRERNRMHAKMTRDRKKCFISTIETTITDLEEDVHRMRMVLAKVSGAPSSEDGICKSPAGKRTSGSSASRITPGTSPQLTSRGVSPFLKKDEYEGSNQFVAPLLTEERPAKRVCHGFSLTDLVSTTPKD